MRTKLIKPIASFAFTALTIGLATGQADAQYASHRAKVFHWMAHPPAASYAGRYGYVAHRAPHPDRYRDVRRGAYDRYGRARYQDPRFNFGYLTTNAVRPAYHQYYYTHNTYGYYRGANAEAQVIYAPQQNYSQTYLVPTTVYQQVTRTYTIPVTTYQQVQRTEYVPKTVYQAVRNNCGCNGY